MWESLVRESIIREELLKVSGCSVALSEAQANSSLCPQTKAVLNFGIIAKSSLFLDQWFIVICGRSIRALVLWVIPIILSISQNIMLTLKPLSITTIQNAYGQTLCCGCWQLKTLNITTENTLWDTSSSPSTPTTPPSYITYEGDCSSFSSSSVVRTMTRLRTSAESSKCADNLDCGFVVVFMLIMIISIYFLGNLGCGIINKGGSRGAEPLCKQWKVNGGWSPLIRLHITSQYKWTLGRHD